MTNKQLCGTVEEGSAPQQLIRHRDPNAAVRVHTIGVRISADFFGSVRKVSLSTPPSCGDRADLPGFVVSVNGGSAARTVLELP